MVGLKQMIKNEMDKDPSFATKVSKIAGYSKPSGFYKFLNKDKSEFKDIQKLVEIVQYAFPDREYEIMDRQIRLLKPNNLMARQALEYANINKLDSLFEFLLDELSTCSNSESKEWAAIYKIDWNVACGKIKPLDGIDKLNAIIPKTKEMKAFKEIAKFYCYNDLRLIGIMKETSFVIENYLSKLSDGFIKRKFECRYHILIADVYLHTGEIKQLREKVNHSIENVKCNSLLARLYHHLGSSYMFEDYKKSYGYLIKAWKLCEKNKNIITANEIKRSLNLVNSFWGMKVDYIQVENDENSILADKAFNKFNHSKEESLGIIKSVNYDGFSDSGKGYYFYYLGVITGEKKYFCESVKFFNKAQEKFYKQMPIIALKKMGLDEDIIDMISV